MSNIDQDTREVLNLITKAVRDPETSLDNSLFWLWKLLYSDAQHGTLPDAQANGTIMALVMSEMLKDPKLAPKAPVLIRVCGDMALEYNREERKNPSKEYDLAFYQCLRQAGEVACEQLERWDQQEKAKNPIQMSTQKPSGNNDQQRPTSTSNSTPDPTVRPVVRPSVSVDDVMQSLRSPNSEGDFALRRIYDYHVSCSEKGIEPATTEEYTRLIDKYREFCTSAPYFHESLSICMSLAREVAFDQWLEKRTAGSYRTAGIVGLVGFAILAGINWTSNRLSDVVASAIGLALVWVILLVPIQRWSRGRGAERYVVYLTFAVVIVWVVAAALSIK